MAYAVLNPGGKSPQVTVVWNGPTYFVEGEQKSWDELTQRQKWVVVRWAKEQWGKKNFPND